MFLGLELSTNRFNIGRKKNVAMTTIIEKLF